MVVYINSYLHLHLVILADAFIQSNLQMGTIEAIYIYIYIYIL